MSAQEIEDLRQKRFREFEESCNRIGGTSWHVAEPALETERHCTLEEMRLIQVPIDIILKLPRDSLYGSLSVERKRKIGPPSKIGVIFEQSRAGALIFNVI